jgi:hypothetical protein
MKNGLMQREPNAKPTTLLQIFLSMGAADRHMGSEIPSAHFRTHLDGLIHSGNN